MQYKLISAVSSRGVPQRIPVRHGYSDNSESEPEPVAGNPGVQTKSNRSNEYSGKPGYSDNPFSYTVIKGYRTRRTGRTSRF